MSAQNEKTALFIDGANLYTTAKSLGLDIDYKRLLREFQSHGHLLRLLLPPYSRVRKAFQSDH